jgi:dienelactone hydrolase
MWALQERLLFYPQPVTSAPRVPDGWRAETVRVKTPDGLALAGVLALPPDGDGSAVIYFGGNAEEVTSAAGDAARLYGERAVLFVNYRGYGESGGRPGEAAIVQDALLLHDWLAAHPGIDPHRIAVHGRSLGSGVAVQVAAARPVRGVILSTPFDSAREVARAAYPWLPVAWLLRHPFDSAARAPGIHAPALVLVGGDDTLIRPERSEALARAWGGPVERRTFAGYGHGDVHLAPGYEASVRDFTARVLRSP